MRSALKRLLLGSILIASASLALLLSDLGRRSTGASLPRIGLLQHASTLLLDEGANGAVDALAAAGYIDGKTIFIDKFNAHGDISVGNSIATQMVSSHYDLLLTVSTLSLQAVANANRGGKVVQVFGLVADPVAAGVGISRTDPLVHPPNLVGIGSFLPVQDAFRIARSIFPGLKRVSTYVEQMGAAMVHPDLRLFGWEVTALEFSSTVAAFIMIVLVGCVMYIFFQTNQGTAMRATGDNNQMVRSLGVNDESMVILGLAISNGLIAVAGALITQYQGFADVQMGIGMVVWGLASVILGEALVGATSLGLSITGVVMGSVLFRLVVAIALRLGLNPNDLKLATALFVFLALIAPSLLKRLQTFKARSSHA